MKEFEEMFEYDKLIENCEEIDYFFEDFEQRDNKIIIPKYSSESINAFNKGVKSQLTLLDKYFDKYFYEMINEYNHNHNSPFTKILIFNYPESVEIKAYDDDSVSVDVENIKKLKQKWIQVLNKLLDDWENGIENAKKLIRTFQDGSENLSLETIESVYSSIAYANESFNKFIRTYTTGTNTVFKLEDYSDEFKRLVNRINSLVEITESCSISDMDESEIEEHSDYWAVIQYKLLTKMRELHYKINNDYYLSVNGSSYIETSENSPRIENCKRLSPGEFQYSYSIAKRLRDGEKPDDIFKSVEEELGYNRPLEELINVGPKDRDNYAKYTRSVEEIAQIRICERVIDRIWYAIQMTDANFYDACIEYCEKCGAYQKKKQLMSAFIMMFHRERVKNGKILSEYE